MAIVQAVFAEQGCSKSGSETTVSERGLLMWLYSLSAQHRG